MVGNARNFLEKNFVYRFKFSEPQAGKLEKTTMRQIIVIL